MKKNRGIISRRQGVSSFSTLVISSTPGRGFSHRFSAFLLFDSLSLSLVSSSLGFILDAPLLPGIHFHAFSWPARSLARPFPSSPSYARFNYQLFRVSQEFALAPPPPPRRHCFLSCVFFPLFLSRSSHGPHPPSLWTSVDKVRACVQIYAKEYSRARKKTLRLSIFLSPSLEPLQVASRFRFLVERGAFFRPSPHHDPTTFPRDNRR